MGDVRKALGRGNIWGKTYGWEGMSHMDICGEITAERGNSTGKGPVAAAGLESED